METVRTCSTCGTVIQSSAGVCVQCLLGFADETGSAGSEEASKTKNGFAGFELLNEGNEGGMGVVYQARHLSLGRVVALKMIRSGSFATSNQLQRFKLEAEAAASLDHPNIVPIYEVGESEGCQYFAMKWIDGQSLAQAMAEPRGVLLQSQESRVKVMLSVAKAVHHAHQRGILHRDLKPANILLDRSGEPHVTDFGIAKKMDGEVDLTVSGAIMGTPSYMSPEQAEGRTKRLTVASDVFSLGAILYFLLTGRAPFEGASQLEIIRSVVEEEPAKPTSIKKGADRDLETICLKCLEKAPERRYASAEALAQELERWLAKKPILTRPVGWIERAGKFIRRHPVPSSLAAGIFVSLVVGLSAFISERHRTDTETTLGRLQAIEGGLHRSNPFSGLLELALLVREQPANPVAGQRLLNFLTERFFLLPVSPSASNGFEPRKISQSQRFKAEVQGQDQDLIRLTDPRTGGTFLVLTNDAVIRSIRFSTDGTRLISASGDATAKIWNISAPTNPMVLPHGAGVFYAEFSPDETKVLTASRDHTAQIWDAITGEPLRTFLHAETETVETAHFSPDSQWVVTATDHGDVIVWRVSTGENTMVHLPHRIDDVVFGPTGEVITIFFGGGNFSFRRTQPFFVTPISSSEIPPGNPVQRSVRNLVQARQSGKIHCFASSPDGRRIATSTTENVVVCWDAKTGLPLCDPLRIPDPVDEARCSSSGVFVHIPGGWLEWRMMSLEGPAPSWLSELAVGISQMSLNCDVGSIAEYRKVAKLVQQRRDFDQLGRWSKEFLGYEQATH